MSVLVNSFGIKVGDRVRTARYDGPYWTQDRGPVVGRLAWVVDVVGPTISMEQVAMLEFEDRSTCNWLTSALIPEYAPVPEPKNEIVHRSPCPRCKREQTIPETLIAKGLINLHCECGQNLIWSTSGWISIPSPKEFKIGDHVLVHEFEDGPHDLSWSDDRAQYVGQVAEIIKIYNPSVLSLKFANSSPWLWPAEACDFQWRLDTISDEAIATGMIPIRLLPPAAGFAPREHARFEQSFAIPVSDVNSSLAMVMNAYEIFQQTVQRVCESLLPTFQAITAAFRPLPSPSDTWHAHVLEGGLLPCPSCLHPIPAQLEPSVREGKLCCPVCNHAGVHELCPVCNGILIQSYVSHWNPNERWHCQDCERRFDDDHKQI